MFSMPKPESDELYEHELIRSSSPVSETTSTLLSLSEPSSPSIAVKSAQKSKRHLSFRGLKPKRVGIMNSEALPTSSEKSPNLSDGETLEATKPKKKKNRAIKLIKKLSLRKKHKVGPKVEEVGATSDGGAGTISSTATTPGSMKRRSPDGATLSMSEGSLHIEEETSDPTRKPETVQITISSKKIEKINQAESLSSPYGEQMRSDRVSSAYNNTNSNAQQQQQQQFAFESHNELVKMNPLAAPITAITEITTTISSSNNGNANENRENLGNEHTIILLEKESTSNPISRATKMSEPTTTTPPTPSNAQVVATATKIIETITTTRTEQIDQFPSSTASNTKPVVLAGIEKEKTEITKSDQTQISTDNDATTTIDQSAQSVSDEERVGQIVASIVLAQSKLAPSILINKFVKRSADPIRGSENNFMKNNSDENSSEATTTSTVDDSLEKSPKVRVLEANDPVQLGNSLKNRNFTPFISVPSTSLHIREERNADDSIDSLLEPPPPPVTTEQQGEKVDNTKAESTTSNDEQQGDIKFDIGTSVRPLRTSDSASATRKLQHSDSIDTDTPPADNSLDSLSPPASETGGPSRRRIAYVQQPTLYTSQEKALLFKNQEYSLASELTMAGAAGMTSMQIPLVTTSETDNAVVNNNDDNDDDADENEDEIAQNMASEKREHLYKILVIGELGTGKTSFIKRYVHQFFSQNYRATIGVDFALKVLNWDQDTIIRLQLWDIAGQERFGNMTRVYYKEAVGAFIVFDVTRSATFDAVIKWKQDLDSKVQLADGSPIPCILLANKCDQTKQGIVTTPAKLDEYVKENGFAGWFETSAKDNINIEDAAKALVNKILLNDKLTNPNELVDLEKIALNGKSESVKKGCVC